MSMSQPLEPNLGRPDEGIPAADAGQGAPEPAEGFGIGGEDPDVLAQRGAESGEDGPPTR